VEPLALLSLMARLGSSKPVELASSMQDLIDGFDVGSFGAAPTKFDAEDLFPLTRAHVQSLPLPAVADKIRALGVPDALAEGFWTVAKANITVMDDLAKWWELLRDGATPLVADEDRDFVKTAFDMLPPQPWSHATWGEWTTAVREATGRKGGALFRPLRRAVTGLDAGPEMADVLPLLQKRPQL
jgi:glutamyl-tRNA synthetase